MTKMLSYPSGFRRSVSSHNIDKAIFLDWLEADNLFLDNELSRADVVDYLQEEQLYDNQSFAWEFVDESWSAICRRLSWLEPCSPIRSDDRWLVRKTTWKEAPAHSYCLVVSLGPQYDGWVQRFGHDYSEQGLLFELITKSAMECRFAGWEFVHTGWSRDNVSKISSVVNLILQTIHERMGSFDDYGSSNANELGVDLVWHLPFSDYRGCTPVYLAQCASGNNWTDKIHEPSIELWTKIVDFATPPNKAFSLPFALSDTELRRRTNRSKGLLLDRYRLLAQGVPETQWLPQSLQQRLVDWLEPRVTWIINHF